MQGLERFPHLARIARDHDLTGPKPHPQRLVPWRVAVGRHADDAAIAEQVVLAVDLDDVVAEIVVGGEVVVGGDKVGFRSGLPLASLDEHRHVGELRKPAGVVEMEMRSHHEGDVADIDLHRRETARNRLRRLEVNIEILAQGAQVVARVAT